MGKSWCPMNMNTSKPGEQQTVMVTGGSGFVGGWAVVELLRRGYRVRTTIRNLAREAEVRATIASQVETKQLSFFAADLLHDAGWEEVVAGADYVLHVASPMPTGEYRGQNVIGPAREGTRRVLEASLKAGVKRVVITSSTAAAIPTTDNATTDETVWTDLPDAPVNNYPRSKTLAERDAWDFIEKSGGAMELSTVLPANIQGPVLGHDYSASVSLIELMLKGKLPALPRIGYGIVDVRDLVELHLLAMTSPLAAGERFIASGEFLWFSDIARILRANLGARAAKVSTRHLPDFVVRLGAHFNPEMAQLAPDLGKHRKISSAKAERMLGWRTRPAETSILDTANSLIEKGLV